MCESKIRTACEVFPNTEWSGAAFYTYTRKKDKTTRMEQTELMIVDFCLQDIGNIGYTEYELNGDTAAYYAEHINDLLGTKVCLLHSHHNMGAFFSSTDMSTLQEQAAQCNNVLSLVVDNMGTYKAKFTERHIVHLEHTDRIHTVERDTWKYMGEKEAKSKRSYNSMKTDQKEYVKIKCWDCEIERPLDMEINEEFKRECLSKIDLFKKQKEAKKLTGQDNRPNPRLPYQPSLFGSDFDMDESCLRTRYFEKPTYVDMANSIFGLSFDYCSTSPYWYRDRLNDTMSDAFLYYFMDAWNEFFSPTVEDIQHVIDTINLRTSRKCNYPQTKNTIINCLNYLITQILDEETDDE